MTDNSSSTSGFFSPFYLLSDCFGYKVGNDIFTAFTVTSFLLIFPLSVTILYLGHQQWRKKCSTLTSHSDFITYHLVVMEIIFILASGIYCIGNYTNQRLVMVKAAHVFYASSCAQMSFHTLTCVERYMAAVHPITYMNARNRLGVRIRNNSILSVWLLSIAQLLIIIPDGLDIVVMLHSGHQALSLIIIAFCSLAVIRVLKRSGPEEEHGYKERVDQTKKKAFDTIMAIMGTLLVSFAGFMFCIAIYTSPYLGKNDKCVILCSSYWLRLPSSMVLPLLFLHAKGKLTCGGTKAEQC